MSADQVAVDRDRAVSEMHLVPVDDSKSDLIASAKESVSKGTANRPDAAWATMSDRPPSMKAATGRPQL
jgi:hypothetical protein